MTKTLKAFHNDPAIKAKYLERVRAHRLADEIVHGTYWENGKGCAVGCTVHSGDHMAYETELGIPMMLARLEDGIFESLGNGASLTWPERFLEAIPVGADLNGVGDKFLHWLLVNPDDGVIRFAQRTKTAIERVGDLYARKIKGGIISSGDWFLAGRVASAAASSSSSAAARWSAAAAAYAAYAADAARLSADDRWSASAADAATLKQGAKLLALLVASSLEIEP